MAIIVDRESEYKGERIVRDAIAEYFSDDVVVYNNREVNGREYDLCLISKGLCVFVIEVKGWLSDKIKVHGIDDIEIDGYEDHQKSPKKQAKSYCIQLFTKLKKKYSVSPLVVDLVAYPYISREQYYSTHLDVISEEQFTLFSDDLVDGNSFRKKFQAAYDAKKTIPHAELTDELVVRIRRDSEPDFADHSDDVMEPIYSKLSVIPYSVNVDRAKKIVLDYANGIKQYIFVKDNGSLNSIINELNLFFKRENIEPGGNLGIGYKRGIAVENEISEYRCFNFEIYIVPELETKCNSEVVINEGEIGTNTAFIEWLSDASSFNMQQYCVEHASVDSNILVEAGAGTGKTYSMVSRVAFLCNKKTDRMTSLEDELAMVTFTNDAALNMKNRLKQMFVSYYVLTGKEYYLNFIESIDRSNISTIHKFSLQLLRGASFYTGLGTNFRISSDEYNRGKIYDLYLSEFLRVKEEENSNFINEIPVPIYDLKKKIIGIADRLLQKSVNLTDIQPEEMGIPIDNVLPYFNEIIQNVIVPSEVSYLESINDRNAMDLKECIVMLRIVLACHADNIQNLKLRYLFIDEFQDTDDVQIDVFQELQKEILSNCRLFVVGDLKQSIYRFRGARMSAFERMKTCQKYTWEVFHLNTNYRTDYRLLELLDGIFAKMGQDGYLPYGKETDSLYGVKCFRTPEEDLMHCIPCHAKDEDAFYNTVFACIDDQCKNIEQLIEDNQNKGRELRKEERTIALLVRNNWQVYNIVEEAKKRGIPIEINSGGDLFQLESTLDLYKLILAFENSSNPVYLVNFIESNYTDLNLNYINLHGMSENEKLLVLHDVLDEFFMFRMGKKWSDVLEEVYTQPILYALKHVYDALKPWKISGRTFAEQQFYMANYDYLLERIIKFSRVDTLTLSQIGRYLEINILSRQKELARMIDSDEKGVHIICTTVHKSKGLEYGTVILPYTAEDISDIRKVKLDANYSDSKLSYTVTFENKIRERNSNYNESVEIYDQISEEARILYVALTRAIRKCIWIKNLDKHVPVSWGTLMEG